MKNTYVLLFFLFFTGICFGQKDREVEKQRIKNLITASFDEVFSELNAKKMDKFYTEDFLLLEDGSLWNRDSISNSFNQTLSATLKEKIIPKRINTIEFIDIKISGGMAWIVYKNYAVWKHETIYGKAHWLESATAIKTKDGWKLQMLHSTFIKPK
jgi:hypothetical protein